MEVCAMIRPTHPDDTPILVAIARGTEVFKPIELVALREVLDDYHAEAQIRGHRAITSERDGRIVGFAYYAPTAMTDRTWHLWWIAVDRDVHARGLGGELLRHAEADVCAAGGRLLLIETSSLPHYELTRRFYVRHGYAQDAVTHDYYADGDDLVVFRKRMAPAEGSSHSSSQEGSGPRPGGSGGPHVPEV
jgi:ribosomal protein S18 acetylase RimI-like enzyme